MMGCRPITEQRLILYQTNAHFNVSTPPFWVEARELQANPLSHGENIHSGLNPGTLEVQDGTSVFNMNRATWGHAYIFHPSYWTFLKRMEIVFVSERCTKVGARFCSLEKNINLTFFGSFLTNAWEFFPLELLKGRETLCCKDSHVTFKAFPIGTCQGNLEWWALLKCLLTLNYLICHINQILQP